MDAMRWIETVVSAALAFALAAPSAANVLHVPSDHLTVTGVVTFARSGDLFAFLRQDDGTCVRLGLLGGNRAFVGERIAAEGDVSMSEPNLRMESVSVSHLGTGEIPDRRQVKISALYAPAPPNWFGLPVEVTVRVMDVNRRRTQLQLYVSDLDREARGVTASFPLRERDTSDSDLRIGAIVRIRAVPSLEYTPEGVKNLTLNILSKDDVDVLSRPSWWTPARVLTAVAIALFVLTALCGWVALLIRARRAEASSQEERLRLARDLHDEFQQQLAGTMFHLDAAASVVENPEAVARQIAGARKSLMNTQSGLRSILWGLQRAGREADTLAGLFRTAAARMPHWGGVVEIVSEGEPPIEIRRQGARLLMILQEAVGNALRHGGARYVAVRLSDDGRRFTMSVSDDGCGFDPAAVRGESGHMGLSNMQARAEAIGGSFSVKSRPGEGTTVEVEIIHD